MALKLQITTESGYQAEYHRIEDIHNKKVVNGTDEFASVISTSIWKDEATRELAKTDSTIRPVSIKNYETSEVFKTIAESYVWLKSNGLENAIDC